MNIKKKLFFLFFIFVMVYNNIFGLDNLNIIREIYWDKPIHNNDKIIVVGRVNENFGSFEFRWIIDQNSSARLVFLEAVGAGELPPVENKLLIMNKEDGVTFIFQQWKALLNKNNSENIKFITAVKTSDLYSVLPFKFKIKRNKLIDKIYKIN